MNLLKTYNKLVESLPIIQMLMQTGVNLKANNIMNILEKKHVPDYFFMEVACVVCCWISGRMGLFLLMSFFG